MIHPLEEACYTPIWYTPLEKAYGGGVYSWRRLAACKLWYTPVGDVPHSCKIWYTPGGVVLHTLFDMLRHP
jgi:hypothetical protein